LRSSATRRAVDIPRITLPGSLNGTFSDLGLNNPNELSQADYNTYSGAAIAGTLALLVPGAFIFDVKPVLYDFLFSALLGGGLGAFLALKKDPSTEFANNVGSSLLGVAGGIDIPRITLPDAISSKFSDLGLNNPNELSQADYNTYSGAAIAGTLLLFVPGAFYIFSFKGFFLDFLCSALLGGGLGAYLALKKDPISKTANEVGGSLLAAVDKLVS
jgi:hypothetical protein